MMIDATYSPEDNKLRFYASERLDAELYGKAKDLGFKWAPKQELFVAPRWTPAREDFCIALAGSIEPEQTTLVERAVAKIDRIEGYIDNAETRANGFYNAARAISQRFEGGQPILVGHYSEKKARKDQERMQNAMNNSVKEREKLTHYNWKKQGVAYHANSKANPRVRANRIKTLLTELRVHQRTQNHARMCLEFWKKLKLMKIANGKEKRLNIIRAQEVMTALMRLQMFIWLYVMEKLPKAMR